MLVILGFPLMDEKKTYYTLNISKSSVCWDLIMGSHIIWFKKYKIFTYFEDKLNIRK